MATQDDRAANVRDDASRFWAAQHEQRSSNRAQANPILVEMARDLAPGRALDLGSGQGDDAIWLALGGWQVTAVDIATIALDTLRSRAEAVGVADRIDPQRHDLSHSFPVGRFDLIAASYLHSPFHLPRRQILRHAANALTEGGVLLIVDHGSAAPWSWNQDPNRHYASPLEVALELDLDPDHWTIARADAPSRLATGPNGETATVTDHVLAYRRADP
jgi:SAM-dependent methyltransferase